MEWSTKVALQAMLFLKCANGTLFPLTGEKVFGSMTGTA
jgi:hypothetical protein